MANKIDLNGRFAVVTGGAQGFGRAITERFLDSGAAGVAIWDDNAGGFHTTVARITGRRGNTVSIDAPLMADCMVASHARAATVFPVVSGSDVRGARVARAPAVRGLRVTASSSGWRRCARAARGPIPSYSPRGAWRRGRATRARASPTRSGRRSRT